MISGLEILFQIFKSPSQNLCVFSQIKDTKCYFHSVACVMPQVWDLGVLGGQKFKIDGDHE